MEKGALAKGRLFRFFLVFLIFTRLFRSNQMELITGYSYLNYTGTGMV
jgi:hypothetical protein